MGKDEVSPPQLDSALTAAPAPAPPCSEAFDVEMCKKCHRVLLKDGGGIQSTVDWQIPRPEALADPFGHVRRAILASLPAFACERVRKLVNAGDGALRAPLFNDVEVEEMRGAVCACLGVGRAWATEQFPCTPYRFNLMERVATQLRDVDVALPGVLKVGSPTGVRCTIPATSGAWRPTASADQDACDVEPDDLDICESN